jgi:uncharacterized membrane protein YgcG
MVPVTVETSQGEATCYVLFGPEAMRDPKACMNALEDANWKVKVWRKSNESGGGGGNNWRGGGGGGGGGGYGGRNRF